MRLTKLSPDQVRRICAASGCDTRTLRKYVDEPTSVREVSRLRLEAAISEIGFAETGNPLWRLGPAMQHGAPSPLSITSAGRGIR